ncbi:aspartate/glutamate racemase family protein [Lentisalinibacter salinarum]|uniref:aspartate/glutamate racemase family protein n=1 Tax=Lentisalinibacter salinarum TaxID=2992239 RepID=UPI003869D759
MTGPRKTIIQLITPIVTRGIRTLDEVEPFLRDDLEIRHSLIDQGPSSIESEFDEALSLPGTIRKAIDAERDGANAIIIDCMGDPGLHACREVVSIPVLGPCQTAMHVASTLGHRFAFITVLERLRPLIDNLVATYGLTHNYASFQAVDIPVLDISHSMEALNKALTGKAIAAIEEDHADYMILGCTGFLGCADAMSAALQEAGHDVPVIDPIPLAVHVADALVKTGLSHSKLAYPSPSVKQIDGYDMPGFMTDKG